MASKKIQLYTDRANTIEASPETSANCVILSDGNNLQKVLDNDLTTPTVVHEETSFKVGVGDVNVSSSVVDGEVGHMVIKGKTYQNILPEPSTHVLTNNKEMFKVNEGLDSNVEIVDGVSKSAILKGQTLVNITSNKKIVGSSYIRVEVDNNLIKPNVQYTLIVNGYSNVSRISCVDNNGLTPYFNIANPKQWNIFTTPHDLTNHHIRVYGTSVDDTLLNSIDVILIEGDYLNVDIPYFTGMQSVKLPVLTTSNEDGTKTNILTTPSDLTLRGIGDVKDTLDCLTGEVVERVGEVVLDGSESWTKYQNTFYTRLDTLPRDSDYTSIIMCSDLPVVPAVSHLVNANKGVTGYTKNSSYVGENWVYVKFEDVNDVDALKMKLSENPITVQYHLANESIKTVDLSTSGNWEKIVLNGSENWSITNNTHLYTKLSDELSPDALLPVLDNSSFVPSENTNSSVNAVWYGGNVGSKNGNIVFNVLDKTLEQFKQCLSQNPITVWYPTVTHKDSTQVKQPIFFKDGHIQLSSGADNSLIPTLDYQAKTSNSYVMDLMKTNTRYTMKAKSASGTFTIDGTSYGAGTNGTFTTPSSMTNKFLVMSNNANEEVMILEGDVVSKTIPYFKGIKSAFEDESKIEVLSTDSNLLINNQRLQEEGVLYYTKGWNAVRLTTKAKKVKIVVKNKTGITGTRLKVKDDVESESNFMQLFAANEVFTRIEREYSLKNSNVISFCSHGSLTFNDETFFDNYDIEVYTLDNMDETLVVEKSNNTKIPLLSPLRSLPNGVCDELIIDRMKKKATLIQRVGVGVLDGTQNVVMVDSTVDTSLYQPFWCSNVFGNMAVVPRDVVTIHCDKLLACSSSTPYKNLTTNAMYQYTDSSARLTGQITKRDLGVKSVGQWFKANPTTVYYLLATPIITEIDLEGYPYIYKDGHIFLNSEIAPVVEIDYNVNQSQQIQANNETLQRHELDILDLDNLIVSFVNAEYNLRLLKFDMELSMMALAE